MKELLWLVGFALTALSGYLGISAILAGFRALPVLQDGHTALYVMSGIVLSLVGLACSAILLDPRPNVPGKGNEDQTK